MTASVAAPSFFIVAPSSSNHYNCNKPPNCHSSLHASSHPSQPNTGSHSRCPLFLVSQARSSILLSPSEPGGDLSHHPFSLIPATFALSMCWPLTTVHHFRHHISAITNYSCLTQKRYHTAATALSSITPFFIPPKIKHLLGCRAFQRNTQPPSPLPCCHLSKPSPSLHLISTSTTACNQPSHTSRCLRPVTHFSPPLLFRHSLPSSAC
ncbi:hypothetical protein AMTRI_Chr01g107920 [Amborella trichopoda]